MSGPLVKDLDYQVVASDTHTVRIATWRNGGNRWLYSITIDGKEVDRGDLSLPRP